MKRFRLVYLIINIMNEIDKEFRKIRISNIIVIVLVMLMIVATIVNIILNT